MSKFIYLKEIDNSNLKDVCINSEYIICMQEYNDSTCIELNTSNSFKLGIRVKETIKEILNKISE